MPEIEMQLFCFGFNGCGQLLQTCGERTIITPMRFTLPLMEHRNLTVERLKTNVVRGQKHCDGERGCPQSQQGGGPPPWSQCPSRSSGRDCREDAAGCGPDGCASDRLSCAQCVEKHSHINKEWRSTTCTSSSSACQETIPTTCTATVLDCIDLSFSSTAITLKGGIIIGCLGGENVACLDLSEVASDVSSLQTVCMHGDDLFCVDDSGNCMVMNLTVAKSVDPGPVSPTPKAMGVDLKKQGRGRRTSKVHIDNRGWIRMKPQPQAGCDGDARCVVSNLAAGDSHVVGVVEADDIPGRIAASESGLYVFHPFPLPTGVKQVSCGKEHALFLTHQGLVYSYGMGSRGQLGHGDAGKEDAPRVIDALASVTIATISAGGWHSACVSVIGDLYMWGWNESGQLGCPSKNEELRPASADDSLLVVTFQMVPELLDLPGGVNVSKVSCGSRHTAAVTYDKRLYTWGWGKYGQLGHGNTDSADSPRPVGFFLERRLCVEDVRCGAWSTVVETSPAPEPRKL